MDPIQEAIKQIATNMQSEGKSSSKTLYNVIIENFETAINNKELYTLPFEAIKIITRSYFQHLETIDKTTNKMELIIASIKKFIENVSIKYQCQAPLLLPQIDPKKCLKLSLEEIVTILGSFRQIPIFTVLKHEYEEEDKGVDFDWEYELEKKNEEIKTLKTQIENGSSKQNISGSSQNIPEKPQNFNSNIFFASMYGDLPSIRYLIEVQHEDINKCDQSHSSPLIYASMNNHFNIVQYMVENGANIDLENNFGNTAIICAVKFGNDNIAKYLLSKGANPNHMNNEKKCALDYITSETLMKELLSTNDATVI